MNETHERATYHGTTSSGSGAPKLNGYDFRRVLGSGSTATVYLYLQHGTEREVAVKVSTGRLDPKAGARFRNEANFMAKLSAHPYILSIYDAGITNDGRSYIVFEYAPGGNYKDILKNRRLSAEETLDIGVNLASALYTAHRNGIVHRDIKTSNILVTAQGLPALADFGISASVYDKRSTGYSLPWAPPEVLQSNGSGTDASDIYSLGATLYAMLAGTSPFEYGYHPRTMQELAHHIMQDPLPSLNRTDVPSAVEQVLARSMSKNPDERYYSALEFARAMQQAQMECFGHATPVTVDGVERYERAVMQRNTHAHQLATSAPAAGRARVSHARMWIGIGVAALVIAGAITIFTTLVIPNLDHAQTTTASVTNPSFGSSSTPREDDDVTAMNTSRVPSPVGLVGAYRGDSVTFTWKNPDPQPGDKYAWSIINGGSNTQSNTSITEETSVTVEASQATQTCIQVSIVRDNRQMSDTPATVCATR